MHYNFRRENLEKNIFSLFLQNINIKWTCKHIQIYTACWIIIFYKSQSSLNYEKSLGPEEETYTIFYHYFCN